MRRHWLITRTIALVLFAILLMLFMIMAGTWAGLAMFAPPDASGPPARQIASLALDLAMLLLCWGGVAMAFGAACRPGVARPAASLIAFAALLLDYAQKLWPALECDRLALAISAISPRSNWSWATHCPWKISWSSGRLP